MIALHGGYKANIKAAHIAALHFKGYGEGSGGGGGRGTVGAVLALHGPPVGPPSVSRGR